VIRVRGKARQAVGAFDLALAIALIVVAPTIGLRLPLWASAMRKKDVDRQIAFDAAADALRRVHDLADVARAVSVAAKLMGESLQGIGWSSQDRRVCHG
jgi:hypothetical protein